MSELDPQQQRAPAFFDAVTAIVGERLVYRMGGPRVTVVDLTDVDVAAITHAGRQLGIETWVRIERADPAHLEAWERLRQDLRRLQDADPRVLQSYPNPDGGFQRPPVRIRLRASAAAAADELVARYGDLVELTVGALPFLPWWDESSVDDGQRGHPRGHHRGHRQRDGAPMDSDELTVALDGPLTVPSGESTRHTVLVTNHGGQTLTVLTNGHLTATILDPRDGSTVGGYSGAQRMPSVRFRVAPQTTVAVPLLVGTDSYRPELGFTVPAGTWALTVVLRLADRRQLLSDPLPLTVT